jgi:hypothetical protein
MKAFAVATSLLLAAPLAAQPGASAKNPLVGTWMIEQFFDTPEGGQPVYAFGNPPIGLFVFTADGHISFSLMRNPPAVSTESADPDPDACIPAWYCSYFGTYRYEAKGSTWTAHILGGNIPNYIGTDQVRPFTIKGDVITVSEDYSTDGKKFHATRILRRVH